MEKMHAWNRENLGERFETAEMRKLLIRAAFYQAKEDGVTVLEIGEDNDENGQVLADGFILDDVDIGYDIYCTSWDMLENFEDIQEEIGS